MDNILMPFLSFFKKETKAYEDGFLDVGNGHKIHYMQVGNPQGIVVLKFHGGPGGSAKPTHADSFNLKKYRVVLFSQRGCGQSKSSELLLDNTTQKIVEDAHLLLKHLGVKSKVIVSGGSFGATLALLFAESYPQKVKALVLNAVFLARQRDIDWMDVDSVRFYPDLMMQMQKKAGKQKITDFFYQQICSEKYKDIQMALQYYGSYEYCLGQLNPSFSKVPAITDKSINSLKIYLFYTINNFFLKENELLNRIETIKHIPTLIMHNRLDFDVPVEQAYLLHQALPKSKLIINPDLGHWSFGLKKCVQKETNPFLEKVI